MEMDLPPKSFSRHKALAFFTFCFCGWICGAVALILALKARDKAFYGDEEKANRFGKASYVMSGIGIVFGLTLIGLLLGVYLQAKLTRPT